MEGKVPPTVAICIGMAGSGKTTFMQRLNADLHARQRPPYIINLDPAILDLPYDPNIDIRDTVDYKQVMRQYQLGPNGGIMTSLNLFATKFDQVLEVLEKRIGRSSSSNDNNEKDDEEEDNDKSHDNSNEKENNNDKSFDYVLIDTPGQIEVFTWSASGAIITETLASLFPTVIVYIVDTVRCRSPVTFMSNMLYACSILYKTQLPFVIVFNKTDLQPHHFAIEWMRDLTAFQAALDDAEEEGAGQEGTYISSMVHSMGLVLEEFYRELRVVGVSSFTGDGMDELWEALSEATRKYQTQYRAELEARIQAQQSRQAEHRKEQLDKLMTDLSLDEQKQ